MFLAAAVDRLSRYMTDLLVIVRTARGRADATAKGVTFGRKPKLTEHQKREEIKRRDTPCIRLELRRQRADDWGGSNRDSRGMPRRSRNTETSDANNCRINDICIRSSYRSRYERHITVVFHWNSII